MPAPAPLGAPVARLEGRDGEPRGQQRLDLIGDVVAACPLGEVAESHEGGGAPPFCLSQQVFDGGDRSFPAVMARPTACSRGASTELAQPPDLAPQRPPLLDPVGDGCCSPLPWRAWHSDYADADSALAGRLGAVQEQVSAALDQIAPGPVRAISTMVVRRDR